MNYNTVLDPFFFVVVVFIYLFIIIFFYNNYGIINICLQLNLLLSLSSMWHAMLTTTSEPVMEVIFPWNENDHKNINQIIIMRVIPKSYSSLLSLGRMIGYDCFDL